MLVYQSYYFHFREGGNLIPLSYLYYFSKTSSKSQITKRTFHFPHLASSLFSFISSLFSKKNPTPNYVLSFPRFRESDLILFHLLPLPYKN